jgi:hypothetical protein
MRSIGLDLHKKSKEIYALDGNGRRLFRDNVCCSRPTLEQFARERLHKDVRFVVEATTNTLAVVAILRLRGRRRGR